MHTATNARVKIHINVRHRLELAKKIFEKHKADGDHSLLQAMEGFNWDVTGPKIGFCLEKHKEAICLAKKVEEIYRQRDAVLAEITDITQESKSILKREYMMNPELLHQWGIVTYNNVDPMENIPP